MFSDVVELYVISNAKTAMGGRESSIESQRTIFAEKKSVRSTEFYQAYQSGLEVTKIFKIWAIEYDDERVLKHEEKYYTIIRTFERGDFLELTCTRRKGLFEESVR